MNIAMATPTNFVTLGELYQMEDNNAVLERLKSDLLPLLPEGWQDFKIINCSKEELFGQELSAQILNKIRFAVPTLTIATAFDPDASYLAERPYRNYKVKRLDWDFCRALILSPPSVANKLRGSAAAAELFAKAIQSMKHMLLTRKEASKKMKEGQESSEDEEKENIEPPKKRFRLDMMEERMYGMFELLSNQIKSLQEKPEVSVGASEYEDSDSISESEQEEEGRQSENSWRPPSVTQTEQDFGLEFEPHVKEAEPNVAP